MTTLWLEQRLEFQLLELPSSNDLLAAMAIDFVWAMNECVCSSTGELYVMHRASIRGSN